MELSDLVRMVNNGYGAMPYLRDQQLSLTLGDVEFDTTLFAEFFTKMMYSASMQKNHQFRGVLAILCDMAITYIEKLNPDYDNENILGGIASGDIKFMAKNIKLNELGWLYVLLWNREGELNETVETGWFMVDFFNAFGGNRKWN